MVERRIQAHAQGATLRKVSPSTPPRYASTLPVGGQLLELSGVTTLLPTDKSKRSSSVNAVRTGSDRAEHYASLSAALLCLDRGIDEASNDVDIRKRVLAQPAGRESSRSSKRARQQELVC